MLVSPLRCVTAPRQITVRHKCLTKLFPTPVRSTEEHLVLPYFDEETSRFDKTTAFALLFTSSHRLPVWPRPFPLKGALQEPMCGQNRQKKIIVIKSTDMCVINAISVRALLPIRYAMYFPYVYNIFSLADGT